MRLRKYRQEDVARLAEIAAAAIENSGYSKEQIASWSSAIQNEKFAERFKNSVSVLVVETDTAIAGFASLINQGDSAGELDMFYVDPTYGRRGVGKILVRAIEDDARQCEMTTIWVDASDAAEHRLEQLGYRVHEKYKKTLGAVAFHNTWMKKSFT